MRRYYLRLSNINIAINIEEKYRDYFSKLFSDFWCMDYSGPSDVVINYKYVEKNIIMNIVDSIQWHRAGIAEMYGQKDGNKYFYMKLLQNGEVDGEKIIICSKDMCYFEVLFDSEYFQDNFYIEFVILFNSCRGVGKDRSIIFHCTGVLNKLNQKVYLFMGKSGSGKSTIAEMIGVDNPVYQVLSDDRIIVLKSENGYYAYGTPWISDSNMSVNRSGILDSIFVLYHADAITLESIVKPIDELVENVFGFPVWDMSYARSILSELNILSMNCNIFKLGFSLESDMSLFLNSYSSS